MKRIAWIGAGCIVAVAANAGVYVELVDHDIAANTTQLAQKMYVQGGSGRFVASLAKHGATKVLGVDVAPEMLKLARELMLKEGVAGKTDFEQMDIIESMGVNPRLVAEHLHQALVARELRQDSLQRKTLAEAVDSRAPRFVHLGHPAGRQQTHELVVT